jgi:hypothetical protein
MHHDLYNELWRIHSEAGFYKFPEEACICGGGKKLFECCGAEGKAKQRVVLWAEFPPHFEVKKFRIEDDPANNRNLLLADGVPVTPLWAASGVGIEADRGWTPTLIIPVFPRRIPKGIEAALREYDLLVCIDGSVDQPDHKRAMVVAVQVEFQGENLVPVTELVLEFIEPTAHPEDIGRALLAMVLAREYPEKKRIGIVNDRSRDPQLGINRRFYPLAGPDYYLPQNMQLIYAREKGSSIGIISAFRHTDRRSKLLRKTLDREFREAGWRPAEGMYCKAWRAWKGEYSRNSKEIDVKILEPPT